MQGPMKWGLILGVAVAIESRRSGDHRDLGAQEELSGIPDCTLSTGPLSTLACGTRPTGPCRPTAT